MTAAARADSTNAQEFSFAASAERVLIAGEFCKCRVIWGLKRDRKLHRCGPFSAYEVRRVVIEGGARRKPAQEQRRE